MMSVNMSAVVPYRGDEVVVALHSGFHTYHLLTGELQAIEDPEQGKDTNRFNDGNVMRRAASGQAR